MKKKILSIMLVSSMVLSLTGCIQINTSSAAGKAAAEATDSETIKNNGKLVIGITDFAPMDYKDESGAWIGFDADLATEFAKSLGVEATFVEIDWDNKVLELDGGTIDCVWNGMTLTSEVTSAMDCSNAYCNNAQVVICKADAAADYANADSLPDVQYAVETGSAGAEQAAEYNLQYTEVSNQAASLMEVEAGTCDAAIIDSLMAAAMVGEGTSYDDLTYTVSLNSEEYGVGFRRGSDLPQMLNSFLKDKYADGTIDTIAEKYGVQAAVIAQ